MTEALSGRNASPIAVNVAGFLRGGLGLGEAARLYVAALQAAGVPVGTTTVDAPLPDEERAVRKETDFVEIAAAGDAPFNLVCVNAPELPRFYRDVGPGFFEGKCSIGVWAWETDHVPEEWGWAFTAVDEIWAYSRYVESILRPVAPVPVVRVPLPVVLPRLDSAPPDLGLPNRFTFLFLFDFFSTMRRKNPIALIEAFTRAFGPGEGPQLLVKSFNGDYKPERLELLRDAAGGHPDVYVVDRYVTAAEKDALIAGCDCYVSLHRAEGFGLPLAEAMALGKPVIATGFGGNLDFMTDENAWLVRHEPVRVGPEGENYPADGMWAEPDVDHAAELMREVWEDERGRRAKAERARREVLDGHSLERVGAIARGRLERISAEGRPESAAPVPPPAGTAWEPLLQAQRKLDFDPLKAAQDEGGAKKLARVASLRAMRPFAYHQEELNEALVGGLREIAETLDRLMWTLEARAGLDEVGLAHLRRMIRAAGIRPSPHHPLLSQPDGSGGSVLAFDDAGQALEDPYAGFEDVFRGSEQLIRERQGEYVGMLAGREPVLELGCGRGEFLDLLRERGVAATGLDLDAGMVERARAKGHAVEHADAIDYLRNLPDAGLPAVFAAQFVEHLAADALVDLLRLTALKLAPGGIAIFETVNPHSPVAFKAFWVDPTHHHPLFPEVLLAFCRFAGFASGRVVFPGASGDFSHDVYTASDYAVVLRAAE